MSNEQIRFYSSNEDNLEEVIGAVSVGSIIVSEREDSLADIYVKVTNETVWHVKPSYELEDINQIEYYINNLFEGFRESIKETLFDKYLYIENTTNEGKTILDIWAPTNSINRVTNNGEFITINEIQDGEENGTFLVGDRAISIGGLRSAAYTESNSYIPSSWTDL